MHKTYGQAGKPVNPKTILAVTHWRETSPGNIYPASTTRTHLALGASREAAGIEELRFWNHQWRKNSEGVQLDILTALHRRTGCVKVMRKEGNHHFVPPNPAQLIEKPAGPPACLPSL